MQSIPKSELNCSLLLGFILYKLHGDEIQLKTEEKGIEISNPTSDEPHVMIIGYTNITYGGITGFGITLTYNSNTKNYNIDVTTKNGNMRVENIHSKSEIYISIENLYVKTYNYLLKYKFQTLMKLKS